MSFMVRVMTFLCFLMVLVLSSSSIKIAVKEKTALITAEASMRSDTILMPPLYATLIDV